MKFRILLWLLCVFMILNISTGICQTPGTEGRRFCLCPRRPIPDQIRKRVVRVIRSFKTTRRESAARGRCRKKGPSLGPNTPAHPFSYAITRESPCQTLDRCPVAEHLIVSNYQFMVTDQRISGNTPWISVRIVVFCSMGVWLSYKVFGMEPNAKQ